MSLFNTILKRPDLASKVREMHLDNSAHSVSKDELNRWKPQLGHLVVLRSFWLTSDALPEGSPESQYRDLVMKLVCIAILSQIRNVERLLIVSDGLEHPHVPLNLHRLVELNYMHRDGWSNDPLATNSVSHCIWGAAPQLRILRGFGLSDLHTMPVNLDSLTEIYLDMCNLDCQSLKELMAGATNLHSFFLSFLREPTMGPLMSASDIFRLLQLRRDTLKWLYLDYPQVDQPPPSEDDMIMGLRGLNALETLIIDDRLLVPRTPGYRRGIHYVHPHRHLFPLPHLGHRDTQFTLYQWENEPGRFKSVWTHPMEVQADMLLPSLKKLVVLSHHPSMFWDLIWISQYAIPLFPSLKSVHLEERYLALAGVEPQRGVPDIRAATSDLRQVAMRLGVHGVSFFTIPSVLRLVQWQHDPDDELSRL